jgi:hypothetical protein
MGSINILALHATKMYGRVEVQLHIFLMEVNGQLHAPAALLPGKVTLLPTV